MTIYNPSEAVIFEAPITKDAIIKCVLMGDYYIELPFNLAKPKRFPRGSYIYYQGRKFEIMSNVRPEFDSKNGGYKYTLKFEAQQNRMKRRRTFWLKSKNAETTFHDTTFLADFGNLIADNMNKFLGGENWKVAAVPDDLATVAKLVSFNGDTCWDAINTIAQTFECEWWTVENGAEVWIYFGKLEFGTPERFERGDVVTSIPAKKGDESNYGTRFYVFGSTRNIPEDYDTTEQGGTTNHISEKRLHLPDGMPYIDACENLAPADIVEQVAFFEDIFPTNTETVTSVETVKRKVENSEDKDRTFDAYVMYCEATPFLPSDMIVGETLGCKFTSGPLNGREFELDIRDANDNKYNPETWKPTDGFVKKFEIIADVETYGDEGIVTIPNASLHPEPGDTFVLTGVRLPKERITEAENKLLEVGKSWAKKNSSDTDVYDCPTNPVYCTRHNKNYELGQKVVLVDADRFGTEGRISRIQGFEKKLWNEYSATYTVGDNTAYSRLGSIESSIEEAAYAERIGVISGVGIYLIRSKYDQTQPTDYNVYSAAAVEAFFLSKIKGGTVSAPVYFKKSIVAEDGIISKDFKEGYFAGAGFRLGKDANGASVLEVDNAIIRKKAVFNEVVINQISFTIGETIFSNGGCECTSVEELDDCYRCYYDNKDGRRYSGLVVGDQVRCQRYDPTQHTIIKYYWRLVVGVGENYIDLSKTDCDGSDIPEEGDNLVQFGHRTDVSRQSAIVINPLNGGSVEAFAGIDSYTLSEKNRIGIGVNPSTGKAYMYGYGDLYFGDRDLTDPDSTWITFQQKEGTDRPKLYIKGNIEMGPDSSGLSSLPEFKQVQESADAAADAANAANEAADKINNIKIGGRNLLLDSGVEIRSNEYGFAIYMLSERINDGQEVTLTLWGGLDDSLVRIVPYNSSGMLSLVPDSDCVAFTEAIKQTGKGSVTFKWRSDVNLFSYTKTTGFVNASKVNQYAYKQTTADSNILKWKMQGFTTDGEYIMFKQELFGDTGRHTIHFTVPRNKEFEYFRFGLNGSEIDTLAIFNADLTPGDYTLSFDLDNNIQGNIEFSHIKILPGYNDDTDWIASLYDRGTRIPNDHIVLFAMNAGHNEQNLTTKIIYHAQLEYGNVSTDWAPAPEDLDFIRQIFPSGLINNTATVSQLLAVRDSTDANANVVAGIYGGGVPELEKNGFRDEAHRKLMIFAGAENLKSVATAGTRIYEDGTIVTEKLEAPKAQITAAEIKDSNLTDVRITGILKSPFYSWNGWSLDMGGDDDEDLTNAYYSHDNLSCAYVAHTTWFEYKLLWDSSQNGRIMTLANVKYQGLNAQYDISISAKSGQYFYEDGSGTSSLTIKKGEVVRLMGYGEGDTFYGWIVISRIRTSGGNSKPDILYEGIVENGTLVKYKSFDNSKPIVTRTGTGIYDIAFSAFINIQDYTVMLTGWSRREAFGREKYFASLYQKYIGRFTVITANGSDKNNGGFTFQVINTENWNS